MKTWKKLGKAILFPHIAIMILLVPSSIALLVYTMVFIGTASVISYVSYVLAFYTLFTLCFRTPNIIRFINSFKNENQYAKRLLGDAYLRVNLSLYGSLIRNGAYAIFQLGLGIYHASVWFYAMAAYYLLLAVMRFFLLRHSRIHKPGEQMRNELIRYGTCGIALLVMNLALTVIILFIVFQGRTFIHHEITTITMAAYTFTAFTVAIVNMIKYRKYNSPVFSASKAINLAAASVSMLTLETTMLTTFGEGNDETFRRIMLGSTGAAVSAFIIVMALYMIINSTKKLNKMKRSHTDVDIH